MQTEITKHRGQTQAQFDAVIGCNVANIVKANWPKDQAPRPDIVSSRHFSTGSGNTIRHFVEFTYSDRTKKVFDGSNWIDSDKFKT